MDTKQVDDLTGVLRASILEYVKTNKFIHHTEIMEALAVITTEMCDAFAKRDAGLATILANTFAMRFGVNVEMKFGQMGKH